MSSTLIPIILVIFLGFALKRKAFVNDTFWSGSDRMVYYVFFPALLISNISTMDLAEVPLVKLSAAIIMLLLLMTAALVLVQKIKPIDPAVFTSVYQGAIRYNTFIAVTLVATAFTSPLAMDVVALAVGVKVLSINVLCVVIFTVYLNKSASLTGKIAVVLKNPLIIACVTGLLLNALSISLPEWLLASCQLLGQVALTLGLLSVGAGLIIRFNDWWSYPIVISVVFKLLVFPVAAYLIGTALELETVPLQVLVMMFAMPTAITAYILAGQLGGDQRVMAKIITIQTMLSGLTLFVILSWIASTQ